MPHLIDNNGVDWHYELQGEGPGVVFLHGWGVDHRIWRQQYKVLSDEFMTVAIDLPGHGQSSFQPLTLDQMTDGLIDVLKALPDHHWIFIGSSLGGFFSMNVHRRAPELVRALVLVGSMPKFVEAPDYPCGLSRARIDKLNGQLHRSYPSIVQIFFRSLFTPQERRSRRYVWLNKFRRNLEAPNKEALLYYLKMMKEEDLRDAFESIDCPMLVINGKGDEICSPLTVSYLKSTRPDAEYIDYEEMGHFPFLCAPYRFNADVKEFLKRTVGDVS